MPRKNQPAQQHQRRFLRVAETARLVGLDPTTLWRMEAKGLFPKRIKLVPGGGAYGPAGHDAGEVEAWIAARLASRGDQQAA